MKPQEPEDRPIDFAVVVMDLAEALLNTKAGTHIAGQLIRSGTCPAPNCGEAGSAESRMDSRIAPSQFNLCEQHKNRGSWLGFFKIKDQQSSFISLQSLLKGFRGAGRLGLAGFCGCGPESGAVE